MLFVDRGFFLWILRFVFWRELLEKRKDYLVLGGDVFVIRGVFIRVIVGVIGV